MVEIKKENHKRPTPTSRRPAGNKSGKGQGQGQAQGRAGQQAKAKSAQFFRTQALNPKP